MQAALENPKSLEGAWKLSRQSEEGEWATLELRVMDNKLIIKQVDAPFIVGINPTKGYAEHSDGALVVVITNGFTDLIFKAPLSRNGNQDRIEGPNRLQSRVVRRHSNMDGATGENSEVSEGRHEKKRSSAGVSRKVWGNRWP